MSSCAIRESSRSPIAAGRATVRLAGFIAQSIVDGPGLRMTVFAQGCPHACVGCHNQHTHDFSGGQEHAVEDLLRRFDKNPLLSGITLSGGEPLARAGELAPLAEGVRLRGKNVWCYTGYTFEEALALADRDDGVAELLRSVDVLVDGRFDLEKRTLDAPFRGSANQRLVDAHRSLRAGRVVLAELRGRYRSARLSVRG